MLGGEELRSLQRGLQLADLAAGPLLPLLSTHMSSADMAADLVLSPHTIKSRMKSIYRKLDATSRTKAVTRSRELGLLGL